MSSENCYNLIDPPDVHFRRSSQELFLRGPRPSLSLSPSVVVNLAASATWLVMLSQSSFFFWYIALRSKTGRCQVYADCVFKPLSVLHVDSFPFARNRTTYMMTNLSGNEDELRGKDGKRV